MLRNKLNVFVASHSFTTKTLLTELPYIRLVPFCMDDI